MNKTLIVLWVDEKEDVYIDISDLRALKAIMFCSIEKAIIINDFLLKIYNQYYKKKDIIDFLIHLADSYNYHELQLLTEECRQEKSLSPFR